MKKQWFARCAGIAKMGPYGSYGEASAALIDTNGLPVEGAFVWPESKTQTKAYARLAKEAAEKATNAVASLYNALADECDRRGMKMPRKAG